LVVPKKRVSLLRRRSVLKKKTMKIAGLKKKGIAKLVENNFVTVFYFFKTIFVGSKSFFK